MIQTKSQGSITAKFQALVSADNTHVV